MANPYSVFDENGHYKPGTYNNGYGSKTGMPIKKNPEWHESDFHSTSAIYPTYVYNVYPYRTMGGLFGNKPVTYYNVRVRFNAKSKGMEPPRASDCAEIYVDNSPYQSYWEAVYEFHDGLFKSAQQKANDFYSEIVNQIRSNKR